MKLDPLFAKYAESAPLEDLRVYLRYAERRLAEYDFSAATVQRIGELFALERELLATTGTPSTRKARVWAAIARFKSSIPGWAGNAGAQGSWYGDPNRLYWRLAKRANGPVRPRLFEAIAKRLEARADAKHRYRVPMRAQALTLDEVRARIASSMPDAPAVATARKPAPPSAATWKARAIAAEAEVARLTANATQKAARKAPRAGHSGRHGVDWSAAGRKAWETRLANRKAKTEAA